MSTLIQGGDYFVKAMNIELNYGSKSGAVKIFLRWYFLFAFEAVSASQTSIN